MSTSSYSSSSSSSQSDDPNSISKSILGIGTNYLASTKRNLLHICRTIPVVISALKRRRTHRNRKRRYIARDRMKGHTQLMADYFIEDAKYTDEMFIRRFRMNRSLVLRIVEACEKYNPYFIQRRDAFKKLGFSSLQKVCAAIRMLAYGCATDMFDEYFQIGESTCIETLKYFCDAIIGVFEEKYLRKPSEADIAQLLREGEERGFPGMLGSLDCMHWEWKNCPTAWHGQYTSGYRKVPTLILEAVASKDLWIWHAFFGMAGSNNDINVLDRSPLFDDIINDEAPKCEYVVNGRHYEMGYYLSDNIYPKYSTLIQTISQPWRAKDILFAKHLEATRKDVERAFGVLQGKWHIVRSPGRLWDIVELGKIMKTCIILHNMIIENQRTESSHSTSYDSAFVSEEQSEQHPLHHDDLFLTQRMISGLKKVRNKTLHEQLKSDLIEHLWTQHGSGEI